ncbi:MAG: serine/threonine protein kinase [Candidatus Ancillula sp.]|jgi:serine/threonine protein kinase|nr:serine/threonine protein kinase [Candidatus Ancillula sp.]
MIEMVRKLNIPGLSLHSHIARGGFADVLKCVQEFPERTVALKLLRPEHIRHQNAFLEEANITASLVDCPNVINVLDASVSPSGMPYFSMPFYSSSVRTLQRHLLSTLDKVSLILQVLYALQFAHTQGVIHRDVKPENILLTSSNSVLLSDFGIAQRDGRLLLHAYSPAYAAPEILNGRSLGNAQSDIFSAGKTAMYILESDRLTPSVQRVLETATRSNPRRRFPTAQDFAEALRQANS